MHCANAAVPGLRQIGKKTEGDLIDPKPDRVEAVAIFTFDLDDIRGARSR